MNPSFATRIAPAVALAGVGFVLVNALDKPISASTQSTDTSVANNAANNAAATGTADTTPSSVPAVQSTPAPAQPAPAQPAPAQAATPQTAAPKAAASGTATATGSTCGAVVSTGSTQNITERRTYGTIVVTAKFDASGTLCKASASYQVWDNRSQQIEAYVVPILNKQAVAAKSANVNGVSGATAVTMAYSSSLQYAIDHKG
jgi:hypothetical protein